MRIKFARKSSAVALAGVLALGAAACGDDDTPDVVDNGDDGTDAPIDDMTTDDMTTDEPTDDMTTEESTE